VYALASMPAGFRKKIAEGGFAGMQPMMLKLRKILLELPDSVNLMSAALRPALLKGCRLYSAEHYYTINPALPEGRVFFIRTAASLEPGIVAHAIQNP